MIFCVMFSSQRKRIFCWKREGLMCLLLENHCQNILFRLFFRNKSIFQFEMISHIKFSASWLLVFFKWGRKVPEKSHPQRSFWCSWRQFRGSVCAGTLTERMEIPGDHATRVRGRGFSSRKPARLWMLLWLFQEHHKMSGIALGEKRE